jgi:hypothetical protein
MKQSYFIRPVWFDILLPNGEVLEARKGLFKIKIGSAMLIACASPSRYGLSGMFDSLKPSLITACGCTVRWQFLMMRQVIGSFRRQSLYPV